MKKKNIIMVVAFVVFALGAVLNQEMNKIDKTVTESLESKAMAFDPIEECYNWCRPYNGTVCVLITNYGFPIVCVDFVAPPGPPIFI
jgi:hypothetical protein